MKKLTILVFYILLSLVAVELFSSIFGFSISHRPFFNSLLQGVPILLLLLHAFATLSVKRGLLFIFLASSIGLLMEIVGINTGTIFGGQYIYAREIRGLFGVPYIVIAYWAVFIYTGYSIVNFWLSAAKKDKPRNNKKNWKLLLFLIILDGYVVTAIDLFMDPIQVLKGSWTWLERGSYFGVPIGNFVGWFLVTVMVTCLYRVYEYLVPKREEKGQFLSIIPVIAYILLYTSFIMESVQVQLSSLIPYGTAFMLPVITISLLCIVRKQFKHQ